MRIAIFLVLLGLMVGGYFFYRHWENRNTSSNSANATTVEVDRSKASRTSRKPQQKPDQFAKLDIPASNFDVFVNGLPAEAGVASLPPGDICIASFDGEGYTHEWINAMAGNTYSPAFKKSYDHPMQDWFLFQGGVQRRGLVVAPDRSKLDCAFTVSLGDAVEASLVGWQDLVFASTENAMVKAVNLQSGKVSWSRGDSGSQVTPVILDEFVFCASDQGVLDGYRLVDGKKRGSLYLGSYATSASPFSDSELLVTTADQRVLFVSVEKKMMGRVSLKIRHEAELKELGQASGSPALYENQAVFCAEPNGLLAVSLRDGARLWSRECRAANEDVADSSAQWRLVEKDAFLTPSPAIMGNTIFSLDSDRLLAVDRSTGNLVWEKRLATAGTTSLAMAYGMVFFGGADGLIRGHSAENGFVVFKKRISSEPIFASPVVFRDKLVVATGEGTLLLLHAFTGEVLARDDTLAGDAILATPLVTPNGIVAVNRKGKMGCFR